jgi:hypothetical protein
MKLQAVDIGALVQAASLPLRVGTRPEGERILVSVMEQIRGSQEPLIVLDLTKLEMVTSSFADEVVAKPLQRVCNGELGERSLVVLTPSREVVEDLERPLTRRDLSVLVFERAMTGPWWVAGVDKPYFREMLDILMSRGSLETGEITRLVPGLNPQACSNRLAELSKRRLIRRFKEAGMRGGQTHTNMSLLEAAK